MTGPGLPALERRKKQQHCVAQAGPELMAVHLPQPLEFWDYQKSRHALTSSNGQRDI